MLRSEPMKLVTVVGERSALDTLVHVLHAWGQVQLAPPPVGVPLEPARGAGEFPAESLLADVRGLREYLRLTPPNPREATPESTILVNLSATVRSITEAVGGHRARLDALDRERQDISRQAALLSPFAELNLPFRLLTGQRRLAVFVASLDRKISLDDFTEPYCEVEQLRLPRNGHVGMRPDPMGDRRDALRVFVAEPEFGPALRAALVASGARLHEFPEGFDEKHPGEELRRIERRLAEIDAEDGTIRAELVSLARERAAFLFAAEEVLAALVARNSGRGTFGVSEYAMAGRFWVPERRLDDTISAVEATLGKRVALFVEDTPCEPAHAGEAAMCPPTSLANARWARPFETLVELFGMPAANEVDPTAVMALFFPLFFGFMVGDFGYGALITLLGLALGRRASGSRTIADFAFVLTMSGVAAAAFGLFVFGDLFGLPFHPEGGSTFDWSQVVPASLLPHAVLVKTEIGGVTNMLVISILAGWLLMGIGCLFGVRNAIGHSLRHAAGHLGQLLLITGFALVMLSLPAMRDCTVGDVLWNRWLAPLDRANAAAVGGMTVLAGGVLSLVGDGATAILEFFGLFGNVISFSRLALVGVSKAAAALALNSVIIPALQKGGSPWALGALAAGLVAGQSLLLALGVLSSSIQSLRLHFCEMFLKFFRGGGVRFEPFGIRRVYTRA